MGKNNKYLSAEEIFREQKELTRKTKMLPIPCNHKKRKTGKLNGSFEGKGDMYFACKACKLRFVASPISDQQLKESINIVVGAINQLKVFSDTSGSDDETIVKLGEIAFNVEEIYELYTRLRDTREKQHSKKNRDNDNSGVGGYGSVSFMSDGGKKKKKKKEW